MADHQSLRPPLLHPDAVVQDRLRDVVVEAALVSASHSGAAESFHAAAADLDALLREMLDRGAPDWLVARVGHLAQQHLDAAEDHAEASDDRLDVVCWLLRRDPIDPRLLGPCQHMSTEQPTPGEPPQLRLLPPVPDPEAPST